VHIRQFATTTVAQYGVSMLIIDYLSPDRHAGWRGRQPVCRPSARHQGLKLMAKDLVSRSVLLCQLNRKIEDRGIVDGLLPHYLSDLKESGCLAGSTAIYLPEDGQSVPYR